MDDQHRLALRLEHQSLNNGPWVVSNGFAREDPQSSSTLASRSKPMRLNSHPQLQSQSSAGKQLSQSVNSLSQASSQARPFDCPWEGGCNKRFNRKSDLQRHYRIHTNERPYSCKVPGCGKSFIQRSALTVHHRTHSGEKPHVCEVETCGKRFSDSSSLARHRRIHTGKRPYKCPVPPCEKSFCRKTTLTKHAERSHRDFPAQQPYLNDLDEDDEDEDEEALEEEGIMRQNSATVAPRYSRNLWLAQSPAYPYIGGELNGPRASSRAPYHNVSRSTELIGYPHPDLGMGQVEDLTVHQHDRHPSLAAHMPVQNESYFGSAGNLSHLDTNAMSRGYSSRGINSATTGSTTQSPEHFLSSADSFQSSPSSIEHEHLLHEIPRSCEQPSLPQDPYANVASNAQYQPDFGAQSGSVPYPQMNDLPLRNVQYGPHDITTQEVSIPLHIQIQNQSQESLHYEPTQISPQQPMILYHDSAMPSSASLQPSPSQLQHQPPQPTTVDLATAREQQRHYEAEVERQQREEQARHEEFLRQEQQRQQEEAALQAQQVAFENEQRMQREEQERAFKTLQEAKQLALHHRQQRQQQQQRIRAEEPQYPTEPSYQDEWVPDAQVEAVSAPVPYQLLYEYPPQQTYGLSVGGMGVEEWKEYDEYTVMPNQRIPNWDGPC